MKKASQSLVGLKICPSITMGPFIFYLSMFWGFSNALPPMKSKISIPPLKENCNATMVLGFFIPFFMATLKYVYSFSFYYMYLFSLFFPSLSLDFFTFDCGIEIGFLPNILFLNDYISKFPKGR